MRVLHIADRLSGRGGADWHLLGVIHHQRARHALCMAVGRRDGTVAAPCTVMEIPGLDARESCSVDMAGVEAWRPDIVHLHNVVNPEVLRWAARRPALVTVQDHRVFCPGSGKLTAHGTVCRQAMHREICEPCLRDGAYFRRMFALTRERLEALSQLPVTVLSHYMKKELQAVGLADDRVQVIPPFVFGLDGQAAADGPPCVLFAGRLVAAKGIYAAVEMWRAAGVALPLVMAGTGSGRHGLERLGVEVTGWLDRQQLARTYRRARAVLFPPRWQEPFGIVGLEALSLGVPVVAWQSGGVAEWHPDSELPAWGDVEAMAARLRRAVEETAEPARGFETEPLMERLEGVYRGIV
ncbi:MAG: glycosyltransferase family 4 protein [Deferrisomatales bacterium]|nr:glycosyltransferase family 4 protein [Deferrisomatales bacterium]